jgi:hypothetical protein
MLTKKSYELIARSLNDSRPIQSMPRVAHAQHWNDCTFLALALAADNPKFDRARFLKACGVAS